VACDIPLESSGWRLNFFFKPHFNPRFAHKVMGPQNHKSPYCGNFGTHLGVPWQNDIWVLVSWPSIEYTIRRKVVASPKSEPWWVLWVYVCPWFVCAPKCYNYTLTNLLFGFCRSVWVSEMLVNIPSPIPKLQHAPLPPKCCEPTPSPSIVFTFGLTVESIKELGGASFML